MAATVEFGVGQVEAVHRQVAAVGSESCQQRRGQRRLPGTRGTGDAEADATDLDALLANAGTTLPAALAEQLKQAGWEVTRRRELVPITLSDGRQVVPPMEQVDIQMSDVAHF